MANRKFYNGLVRGNHSVNAPWTVKETVCAPWAYTTGVFDCSVLGVTDGNRVLLMHICPTNSANSNWGKIEKFIVTNIKKRLNPECLQGLMLGSKFNNKYSPDSPKLFDFLAGVLNKLNIPYSKFKGGDYENNVLYDSLKDEWFIGNELLDIASKDEFKTPKNLANKIFDEVKISGNDELIW